MEDVCARLAGEAARRIHLYLVLETALATGGAACRELDCALACWGRPVRIPLGNFVGRDDACIIARPFAMAVTSIFEGLVCVRHLPGVVEEEGQHMALGLYLYCCSCCYVLC